MIKILKKIKKYYFKKFEYELKHRQITRKQHANKKDMECQICYSEELGRISDIKDQNLRFDLLNDFFGKFQEICIKEERKYLFYRYALDIDYIFKSIKKTGTKNSIEQFIYLSEEFGEVAECLRSIKLIKKQDKKSYSKTKNDLSEEIGDLIIIIILICKFENLNFFQVLKKGIQKQYLKWYNINNNGD